MQINVLTLLAIHVLQELEQATELLQIRHLAQKLNVTVAYAKRVVTALSAAGIIEGVRGTTGGYRRKRSALEIPLRDFLAVLEGLFPAEAGDNHVMQAIRAKARDKAFIGVTVADCFPVPVTTAPLADMSDFLDARQVAKMLHVTKSAVNLWVQTGKLPAPQIVDHKQVWPRAAVKKLARKRQSK
jgi:DNA-binding IscR family transcriptional regulator